MTRLNLRPYHKKAFEYCGDRVSMRAIRAIFQEHFNAKIVVPEKYRNADIGLEDYDLIFESEEDAIVFKLKFGA